MTVSQVIFATGGSFRWHASIIRAAGLGRALRERGVQVGYVLMDAPDSRELLQLYGVHDACQWIRGGRNPLRFLSAAVGEGSGRVVHVINAPLAGQLVALKGRRRGAVVIADWDEWLSRVPFGLWHCFKWRMLERLAVANSDAFVFSSEYLRTEYSSRVGRRPAAYIPYGMSVLKTGPCGEARAGWAGLDAGLRWMAYTGSLHSAYRLDLLELVTLAEVCREEGLGLAVVGDGSERVWLETELRRILPERQVHFTGWLSVDALDSFLVGEPISACFLPLRDSMQNRCRCPNKMFHYVKARKPIVTNRVGEVKNLLAEGAYYFEPGEAASLRQAVQEALIGRPAYDLETFSWDCRADAYLRFIRSLPDLGR